MKKESNPIDYAINETQRMAFNYSEKVLAVVIDTIYQRLKDNFVDYENKTHKLGWFKELVKEEFHNELNNKQK